MESWPIFRIELAGPHNQNAQKLAIIASVAIGILPSLENAKTLYTCTVKETGNSIWIPPRVDIVHDEATGELMVHDGIIYSFYDEKPLPARVATDNKNVSPLSRSSKNRLTVMVSFSRRSNFALRI